jgi:hypothetical protein
VRGSGIGWERGSWSEIPGFIVPHAGSESNVDEYLENLEDEVAEDAKQDDPVGVQEDDNQEGLEDLVFELVPVGKFDGELHIKEKK